MPGPQIGQVAEDLAAAGGEPILDDGSGLNRGVIPMKKPPLLHQDRPLLSQVLHEEVQDLHNVCCIDGGAPGDDVRVVKALAVKESEQHLFGPAGMNLSLYWFC